MVQPITLSNSNFKVVVQDHSVDIFSDCSWQRGKESFRLFGQMTFGSRDEAVTFAQEFIEKSNFGQHS